MTTTPSFGPAWLRPGVYTCFFITGATALVLQVLWSNQFVTVFGNSSYAVSIVLCAYMSGLGLGSLVGGKLADRIDRRLAAFGLAQIGVACWTLAMPLLIDCLRETAPKIAALSPESLLISTLARFVLAFAVLALPCFLMGATLPLLTRAMTESDHLISQRIGALYCWNTLGAASGCAAAGFWMLDTLGLRATGFVAAGTDLLVGLIAYALARRQSTAADAPAPAPVVAPETTTQSDEEQAATPGYLLLSVAFTNGLAGLACEVLWFRYLAFVLFLGHPAYVFSTIICVYLAGLGLGGLIYRLLARKISFSARAVWILQLLLALSVLVTFAVGARIFSAGPPPPLRLKGLALVTVLPPTVLMGMCFPLLCNLYGRQVRKLGQRVGLLVAVNTAGTVLGSLLPVFLFIPLLGIQRSIVLASLLFGGTGLMLMASEKRFNRRVSTFMAGAYGLAVLLFLSVVPSDLCQRVFLATDFNLSKNADVLFYREGRTGTAVVTRDRVNDRKVIYINGNPEVPALYAHQLCFKMLGDLAPMIHPRPDEVLMVCFGGGIAAGATANLPQVKALTIVDLESSVVEAASLLETENNGVLKNPKTDVVIDDGRNYIATSRRKWPVIITDSTHPKAPDSWVLYSREFYRQVRNHLTDDGIFVQWVPFHDLSTAEYKMIVRTFQSVFPHASLWSTSGMDERGQFIMYTLLMAGSRPLGIDVAQLRDRLAAEPVRRDLEPYGLHTPAGFLDGFICAEDKLRQWAGDGPLNTDDLPYIYYDTSFAEGQKITFGAFITPMEDIWPYLSHTGTPRAAQWLRHELGLRANAGRLALSARLDEAFSALPDDPRFQINRRLLREDGPRYVETLARTFWNDPQGLVYAAGLGAPGPSAFQAAGRIYERVLQLDSDNLDALNMLGCMRSDMNDLAAAENYLGRALRLKPDSASVQYNVATLFLKKGSANEAILHYKKALELAPDHADAHSNLGTALLQLGNIKDAIVHYQRAVQLKPESANANYNLGSVLSRNGRVSEAVSYYRKSLEIKPDDAEVLADLSWVLATSTEPSVRDGNMAVNLAERANQLTGGELVSVLHTLAAAYAETGRFYDATRIAQKAFVLARSAGREDVMRSLADELKSYMSGRPLRQ